MHERFLERFEVGLTKLQQAAEKGLLRDPAVAHQRLGRLKERYWRAAGAFEVQVTPLPPPAGPATPRARAGGRARLSVTWTRNGHWQAWASLADGCYLLRTNRATGNRKRGNESTLAPRRLGGFCIPCRKDA